MSGKVFAAFPMVSIIVPARNESGNIARCLTSIARCAYPRCEVIVVDDCSTDGTPERVKEFERSLGNVRLVESGVLPPGWTGKNWALSLGIKEARGDWLLFLDADTELYPRALCESLLFAQSRGLDMLSYSPEQELRGLWERAIQPVVFDILDSRYSFDAVNDPGRAEAAANGQFILARRSAYEQAGGHESVRGEIVEDVALARNLKRRGKRIFFAHGGGVVKCRMYHSLGEIFEGWSKNLFVLSGGSLKTLALLLFNLSLRSLVPGAVFVTSLIHAARYHDPYTAVTAIFSLLVLGIVLPAGFSAKNGARSSAVSGFLYSLGCIMVIVLLITSAFRCVFGAGVRWKGRRYPLGVGDDPLD